MQQPEKRPPKGSKVIHFQRVMRIFVIICVSHKGQ